MCGNLISDPTDFKVGICEKNPFYRACVVCENSNTDIEEMLVQLRQI